MEGDPAPGKGGGHFDELDQADLNDEGRVVFVAEIAGGAVGAGVFLSTPGSSLPALPASGRVLIAAGLVLAARSARRRLGHGRPPS